MPTQQTKKATTIKKTVVVKEPVIKQEVVKAEAARVVTGGTAWYPSQSYMQKPGGNI
jgi:hypothetical protein